MRLAKWDCFYVYIYDSLVYSIFCLTLRLLSLHGRASWRILGRVHETLLVEIKGIDVVVSLDEIRGVFIKEPNISNYEAKVTVMTA